MRAEPKHVLELLWQHPQVPRSVRHCLDRCRELLAQSTPHGADSPGAPETIESLVRHMLRVDWIGYVPVPADEDRPVSAGSRIGVKAHELEPLLKELLDETLHLHTVISDAFLNHQARIAEVSQPYLRGL
jgi:uncharacterized alpha-E superfamily protein